MPLECSVKHQNGIRSRAVVTQQCAENTGQVSIDIPKQVLILSRVDPHPRLVDPLSRIERNRAYKYSSDTFVAKYAPSAEIWFRTKHPQRVQIYQIINENSWGTAASCLRTQDCAP
jgi:hypothetical protein